MEEEISYLDLNSKVEELKKYRASLRREIDQNQLEAQNLRDGLRALGAKMDSSRKEALELETLVIKHRNDLASIDASLDKKHKIVDTEKRDLEALRERVNGENAIFQKEKSEALDVLENQKKKQVRFEVSLMNREKDIQEAEKQIAGQIGELSERRQKIGQKELEIQSRQAKLDNKAKEIERSLSLAKKEADDAVAARTRFETLTAEVKKKEDEFDQKQAHIRTCYNEIELKKSEITSKEQDLAIEYSKLASIRTKLTKEIEYAKIPTEKREMLIKELN